MWSNQIGTVCALLSSWIVLTRYLGMKTAFRPNWNLVFELYQCHCTMFNHFMIKVRTFSLRCRFRPWMLCLSYPRRHYRNLEILFNETRCINNVYIRVAQKIENYVIAGKCGWGNYKMILLHYFRFRQLYDRAKHKN